MLSRGDEIGRTPARQQQRLLPGQRARAGSTWTAPPDGRAAARVHAPAHPAPPRPSRLPPAPVLPGPARSRARRSRTSRGSSPTGEEMTDEEWNERADARCLGLRLAGTPSRTSTTRVSPYGTTPFSSCSNADDRALPFVLPDHQTRASSGRSCLTPEAGTSSPRSGSTRAASPIPSRDTRWPCCASERREPRVTATTARVRIRDAPHRGGSARSGGGAPGPGSRHPHPASLSAAGAGGQRARAHGRRPDGSVHRLPGPSQHGPRAHQGRHPLPPGREARRGHRARDAHDLEVRARWACRTAGAKGGVALRPRARCPRASSST